MNFRRCITVLAVFALFAGLASAQVADNSATGGGPFQCNAAVVPPNLRAEGMTELVGDIVLTCTGGGSPALNSATPLPTAQVTVSLGANVTSRLLTYATVNPSAITATNTSEALLLIDEPGAATVQGLQAGVYGNAATNAPGFGPNATQYLCGAAAANTPGTPSSLVGAGPGGCVEYASEAADGDFDVHYERNSGLARSQHVRGRRASQPGCVLWHSDYAPVEHWFGAHLPHYQSSRQCQYIGWRRLGGYNSGGGVDCHQRYHLGAGQ